MRSIRKIWWIVAVVVTVVAFFACGAQAVLAQGLSDGSIEGTVTDTSGAILEGAMVTITNPQNGISRTITTGKDGLYNALNLPVGTYTVKVEKSGFGVKENENVQVNPGKASIVDVQIAVGSVAQTVKVQAGIAPITQDTPDRSVVLQAETLMRLPLQVSGGARQVDAFIALAPGVTGDTFSARINGAPDFSQDFYYDGIPYMNADGGGRQEGLGAPFEAVDEYAINTSAYSAAYGRGSGLLNFHIRSGTNHLHGGAWEFLRNDALDAQGFKFSPTAQKATEKQHEFGYKVGGPVFIPKIYDGRDKTFFFFNMDWFKFKGGASRSLLTLPTTAMRSGDFSALLGAPITDSSGRALVNPCDNTPLIAGQIFDPSTTRTVGGVECRTAFPGNIIPGGRESALSAQYMSLIPPAGSDAIQNNTPVTAPGSVQNNFFYLFKIDHNIGSRAVLHASFYKGRTTNPSPATISGPLGSSNVFNGSAWEPRVSLDYTLTTRLVNQILYSTQYTEGVRIFSPLVPSSFTSPIATPGLPYPALAISGEPTYGSGLDNNQNSGGCWPCGFLADNLKWVKGRHGFTFGTELRWEDERDAFAINIGTYSFGNLTTSLPGSSVNGQLGFGFASFYLGAPNTVSRTGAAPPRLVKTGYRALFAQDDFMVNSKLTLNLGLRWDTSLPAWNSKGYFSTFDPTVPNPSAGNLPGSMVFAGTSGGPCISQGGASLCRPKIANTYYSNWQPRIGFAYRISDRDVVRGGFGLSTVRGGASTLMGPEIAASFLTGYQYQDTLSSPDGGFSVPTQISPGWDVGLPPVGAPPPRTRDLANGQSVQYMRPVDGKSGYIQNWSLTYEHQLPWRIGAEVSYVGSSSVRIGANLLNPNQVPSKYLSLGSLLTADISSPAAAAAGITAPYPGFTGSVAQALRPFPQFQYIAPNTQNTGHQSYNSLQLRAQKYFSNGLTFLVSYTWSKTLTNGVDQFSTFSSPPQDAGNLSAEKRVLGGTPFGGATPRSLSVASTYELPIGPGKQFLTHGGIVGKAVGGWGLGAVLAYQAGSPLPISGGSQQPLFNGPSRPNIVKGVNPKLYGGGKFHPFTQRYLTSTAFSDPGAFAFGDAPPTLPNVRGFPFYNENISILKDTKIKEAATLQFRAEMFNAFNRVVFGSPDTNWNDSLGAVNNFGIVTSQANSPRVIQFGLRLDF